MPTRALILCAGMGSRLQPFTNISPKPLLTIGGQTLLERSIAFLKEAGVKEIALITGYKREQFSPYIEKYNLTEFYNPDFATKNNYASLLCAKNFFKDCLIIEGDLYLERNVFTSLLQKINQQPTQSFLAVQETKNGQKEWQIQVDEKDRLLGVIKNSTIGYALSGVSYWAASDADYLSAQLLKCTTDDYWEDAMLQCLDQLNLLCCKERRFQSELDSLYDGLKLGILTPEDIAWQCTDQLAPEKLNGLTNNTYLISQNGQEYVLRVANPNMGAVIDRANEELISEAIEGYNVSVPARFFAGGLKVTPYRSKSHILSVEDLDKNDIRHVIDTFKRLHQIPYKPGSLPIVTFTSEIQRYEAATSSMLLSDLEHERLMAWAKELDEYPAVISHRDPVPGNILITGDTVEFIDFEYAGCTSRYWDIGAFLTEIPIDETFEQELVERYGNLSWDLIQKSKAIVAYIWALWGFFQDAQAYGRWRLRQFDSYIEKIQN